MGTRHLSCAVVGGQYKIAQYGQWDGYPEGQGVTALDFARERLSTRDGRQHFREKLNGLKILTDDEVKKRWEDYGAKGEFVSMDIADEFKRRNRHLSRDCGANIFALVYDGKATDIDLQVEFANDSLFCEFAYVIDLDKNTFEAFVGFNKEKSKPGERFFAENPNDGGYYPVKPLASYSLDALPTNDQFLADCNRAQGDGE